MSASTRRVFGHCLRGFAEWASENWPMAKGARDVDRVCAQAYAASLAKGGLSIKSQRNYLGVLVTAWNDLKRGHDGLENPWPLAMPAPGGEKRGEAFTPEEAERIFRAGDADGHGWGLAARIAACTGLRLGDVLTLRHEDIQDGAIVTDPIKTKRWHIAVCLPLPPEVAALIGEGVGPILPELAACYRPGYELRYPFSRVLKAAGVDPEKYTFHSFRHYFRTRLAAAGVSDDVAMRLGGWTQRSTAARYDHDEHREELAAAIQAAWTAR
jgi:integrase